MKNKKVKAILALTVLTIGVGATIAVGAMSSKSEPVVENTVVAEEVVEELEEVVEEVKLVNLDVELDTAIKGTRYIINEDQNLYTSPNKTSEVVGLYRVDDAITISGLVNVTGASFAQVVSEGTVLGYIDYGNTAYDVGGTIFWHDNGELASGESDLVYFDTQEELDAYVANWRNEQAELRASEDEDTPVYADTDPRSMTFATMEEALEYADEIRALVYAEDVEKYGQEIADKLAAGETVTTYSETIVGESTLVGGGGSQPTGYGGLGPDQLPLYQHDVDVSNAIPHTVN